MENINVILEKFKQQNLVLSLEEERKLLFDYVYVTNKLEGNKLTLSQTTQLLSTDTVSGNNIRLSDILEQKGMYAALIRMLKAVKDKEELSIELLIEINWLVIGALWKKNDTYPGAKLKGQNEGDFKIANNIIQIKKGNKIIEELEPLSNPKNVKKIW
ncbi:MAG: hypothetical protein ACK5NB_00915 [Flavobacteriaceae bacterium]